jgi:hypothetical protein
MDHGGLHWPRASPRSENGLEPERLLLYARCRARALCDQKQSAARAACTLSRAHDDLTTMCALPIVIGGQGSRSLRHFVLRPARGSELPRPLLHLRHVRAAGQLQQGGDRPLSLRRLQSCTLLRCQSSMLLHHVAAPRRGGVQRALFFFSLSFFCGVSVRDFAAPCPLCSCARWCQLRVCVVCACVRVILRH